MILKFIKDLKVLKLSKYEYIIFNNINAMFQNEEYIRSLRKQMMNIYGCDIIYLDYIMRDKYRVFSGIPSIARLFLIDNIKQNYIY